MKFHPVDQRSPEWHALRLGIPTASEFHRLVTPGTLLKHVAEGREIDPRNYVSKQAPAYMYRLLAEHITGQPCENAETQWMSRGTELEDQAVLAYEGLAEVETQPGGFFTTDDGLAGCSPDRLVGDDGILEMKCPLIQTQVQAALEGTTEDHIAQLQGQLWITGRAWVDVFSFHPLLVIPPVRVKRNERFIDTLAAIVGSFTKLMLEKRAELERRFGPFERKETAAPPEGDFDLTDDDVTRILEANRHDRGLRGEGLK